MSNIIYIALKYFYYRLSYAKFRNKLIIAIITGLSFALIQAPFYLFFLLFILPTIYLIILQNVESNKKILLLIFCFLIGFYLSNFYWISFSALVVKSYPKYLFISIFFIIPLLLTLYHLPFLYLHKKLSQKLKLSPLHYSVLFAILWFLSEMLRSYSLPFIDLQGLPWNLIGHSTGFSVILMQISSIIGIFGLSFILIILASLPYVSFVYYLEPGNIGSEKQKNFRTYFPLIIIIVILLTISIFGMIRINNIKTTVYSDFNIRLVNPAITQHHEFKAANIKNNLDKIINMTINAPTNQKFDLIIWPETTVAGILTPEHIPYIINQKILNLLSNNGHIILGSVRIERKTDPKWKNIKYKLFNTLFLINKEGKIVEFYDKKRLVPFGEYNPYTKYFTFIPAIARMNNVNISSGNQAKQTIALSKNLSFAPLICYDIAFSGKIIDRNKIPNIMINISNEIWFKRTIFNSNISTQATQHFATTKIRSIEEGIPILRTANNGITAVIDAYGRNLFSLSSIEEGVLDAKLPQAIKPNQFSTFYAKYAIEIIWTIFILSLFIIGYIFFINYKSKNNLPKR